MSFAEGIGAASFDLADPVVMACALAAAIVIGLLLDAPAIAGAVRRVRALRRRAKAVRVKRAS
jgi:hypothetical protein